jgi:hypothetical protein
MKGLRCEFFIYEMLMKRRLYKKKIRFKRIIFSSSAKTMCMQYNCPHRINIGSIKNYNVDIEGLNDEDPICQVCDGLLRKYITVKSRWHLLQNSCCYYYIPDVTKEESV